MIEFKAASKGQALFYWTTPMCKALWGVGSWLLNAGGCQDRVAAIECRGWLLAVSHPAPASVFLHVVR